MAPSPPRTDFPRPADPEPRPRLLDIKI